MSESKSLHPASLVQYLLMERRQLLYAHCSTGNVIYGGRMCIWGSQHFKRHQCQDSECYPLRKDAIPPQSTFFHSLLLPRRTGTSSFNMTYINECVCENSALLESSFLQKSEQLFRLVMSYCTLVSFVQPFTDFARCAAIAQASDHVR